MFEATRPPIATPSLKQQKFVLSLAFLIIVAVSALAFISTQRLIAASDRIERTQAVLVEVNRYLSEIKDVESRSRAYYVTGDDRFLTLRSENVANAQRSAAQLRSLPAGAELRRRIDHLLALADERLEYSDRLVRQRGSSAEAVQTIRAGADVMDQVRGEAEAIIEAQAAAYRAEQGKLERQAWTTNLALAAGVILCLGIIASLFTVRGREVARRRQLEEELRALNVELEDRVQERTSQVKRASDLLDAVVENLPDMVLLKEPHGEGFRYVLANAAAERLLGRNRSEIVGRTESDLFPAEEAALVVRTNQAVAQSGKARTFANRKLTTPNGVRTVESRVVPIFNGAGGLGLILAIIRDVTERQEREEQLRQLDERVKDSERRASLTVDAALDAVITIDDSGSITGWNPQAEKIFGWPRDEVLGEPVEEIVMPERYRQAHRAGLARYLATGDAKVLNRRIELVALRRDGTEFPVELAITPMRGTEALTFSAFIRDLTEHKAREEQVRQLQRMDAIGRLTGGVAHDFNNLLAIIHGNSELLREGLKAGSEEASMTDDVIGAAARGAELVRRLLAFARMQHLEAETVDLNARLQDVLALLQRALGENISLKVKTARRLWPATIDPTQVDDALVNLAINARDAMPDGGTLTIETRNVSLDEDYAANHVEVSAGDYVMLAVSDTGTGMSSEVISRAFEPFFTTKEEGKGTGLGLSQVFGWVKQSGGHIKIYSELGHGTTVKLFLPRAAAAGAEKEATAAIATPNGDETILVVEDNASVRKTVIRQLRDLGYVTLEAENGAEALQLVRNGARFDLLLTDVIMPGGITGYQLAHQLRLGRPGLKVLFTSGYTELAGPVDEAARKDMLLSKPYRKQDLGRAVRAALDSKPAAAA